MKSQIKFQDKLKTNKVFDQRLLLNEKKSNSINVIDSKFYQKLFLLFLTVPLFLIFPESAKESENICNSHYTREICNIW